MTRRVLCAVLAGMLWGRIAAASAALQVEKLRCEYVDGPLAVDVPHPRLSWILRSDRRGERQTAYQVLVSGDARRLAAGKGDLWDSGKTVSDRTSQVAYSGRPLASRQECFWKVRVWGRDGKPSRWSRPVSWGMGLLEPADWNARWITADGAPPAELEHSSWVWTGEGDARLMAPPGTRCFRRALDLDAQPKVLSAMAILTADNRFTLWVNGREALSGDSYRSLFTADVASLLRPGRNVLAVAATNDGESRNEAGLLGVLIIRLSDGQRQAIPIDATWRCRDREDPGWKDAGFDDAGWAPARVLGPNGMAPWGRLTAQASRLPLFRWSFVVSKRVRRASLYACGLGQHEVRLNGSKVGDGVLEPGWTNYRTTCLYCAYDVTSRVKRGHNALGVLLGNGMYNVTGGRYTKFTGSFGPPKLIAQLHLEYADGSSEVVATDGEWKTAPGPVTFSCTYGGEDYDARQEQPGWDAAGFDDSSWASASVTEGPGGRLVGSSQSAPPIRVAKVLTPLKRTRVRPGEWLYDLGQNCSLLPRLSVRGAAGSRITILTGEKFEGDRFVGGCSNMARYTYVLRGGATETWTPRFTYVGARYLLVQGGTPPGPGGDPGLPVVESVEGLFVCGSAEPAGEFACSSDLFNRTAELIRWAMLSNMVSTLTDCPHREKLGWLEQDHLVGPSLMYRFDLGSLFTKVVGDMADAQLSDGLVPDIAPEYVVFDGGFRDSPEWGSAYVLVPWGLYQWYGDVDVLRRHYAAMQRYVAYLGTKASGGILSHGLADWIALQQTPTPQVAAAFYYLDLAVMGEIARVLGKEDDATRYSAMAGEVRRAYNARFYDARARRYATGSQTANALPVALGIVEPGNAEAVVDDIVADVRRRGNALTAGDVGYRYLLRALADHGRSDVVFDMNSRSDQPGYGMMLARGATSLPETWDANPGTSLNHFMLGHILEWFYADLAGIRRDPDAPGFGKIVIAPQPVGDLQWVRAHYDSIQGRIGSSWRREGGTFALEVTIPPNTTATVCVPASAPAAVTESGKPAAEADGVTFLRAERGAACFAVGSGTYRFAAPSAR